MAAEILVGTSSWADPGFVAEWYPPGMPSRDGLDVGPRGRVRLTPGLERELLARTLEAVAPLEQAGKLGAFLLQLTPAFSPRRHTLDELSGLVEAFGDRALALEFRHRGWVEGQR